MPNFVKHATDDGTSEFSYYNINAKENSHFSISVIGRTMPDHRYSIFRDRSASHAIECIIEGNQIMEFDGKKRIVAPGNCVLIKQKAVFSSTSDSKHPVQKVWICFRGHMADILYQMYGIHDDITIVPLDLADELSAFHDELLNGDGLSFGAVKIHSFIQRLSESLTKKKRVAKSNLSEKVCSILNDNIFGEVSLDDISNQFFVSKTQLIRAFKKDYGLTPYRYFLLKKIDLAKDFLKNTNHSVKKISEILCFSDEMYFCKLFKNIVGITPGKYRKI